MPFDIRNRSPHRILERGGRSVREPHHLDRDEIVSGADPATATVYLDTTKHQHMMAGAGLALPVDQALAYAQKFPIGRAYNERDPSRFGIITNVYVEDSSGQRVPFTPTRIAPAHHAAPHHAAPHAAAPHHHEELHHHHPGEPHHHHPGGRHR